MLITDARRGLCGYQFQAGDLPDAEGDYLCDLQLTDADGRVETVFEAIIIKSLGEIAA